ncbi:hypothetical protein AVEN_104937-1 [Araneus ventricosus]|uniref:Histone H2A n=1 Tax=Araneus ventricosus TaxID=182803 RepID=A0A4Y2SN06_ARAVE|nr:hypothetical protein AVEN_104937-1 [Araneus ventricosus]
MPLVFPASRFPTSVCMELLKSSFPQGRVHPAAAVYLASTLEYLGAEILEVADTKAQERKRTKSGRSSESSRYRITLEDMLQAIYYDDELKKLVDTVFKKNGEDK